MKSVYFLLNKLSDFNFSTYIERYLGSYHIGFGTELPDTPLIYDIVVLWNYRKIISKKSLCDNFIVFHSSDLPKGRGWAPIYYSLANAEKYYTICGIKAAEMVDSGEIIAKARFEIKDNYLARHLRSWDEEICILLIAKILENLKKEKGLSGCEQRGTATYYKRRYPNDNEISIDSTIKELIPHLRACEEAHPAFFFFITI